MKTVSPNRTFRLTKPCPYCGGTVSVRATGWTQEDDGTWTADMLDMECDTEPDIDGNEWPDWSAMHGDNDFCEAWYSLQEGAIRALKAKVRFDLKTES